MLENKNNIFKRGSVILCNLCSVDTKNGSIQFGLKRPCIVISNNLNNNFSNVLTVIPLSTSKFKKKLPTHVEIDKTNSQIERDSIALCEQPILVNKDNIIRELFMLDDTLMEKINIGVMIQLGLTQFAMNRVAV